MGQTPIGAIAHSRSKGKVLLFDYGEDGDTLRCREIFDDGLGEVLPLLDLDEAQPIIFESRLDFPYEEDSDWV